MFHPTALSNSSQLKRKDLAMEAASLHAVQSMFWTKIGKWQALTALMTLTVYFLVKASTDDRVFAANFNLIVLFIAVLAGILYINNFATFGSILTAIAIAATACVTMAAIVHGDIFTITMAVVMATIATTSVVHLANENWDHGVSKKVIWLSFTAEFVLILVFMLI